nr:uncharacterized protein LOC109162486 [Ipomoea batatas]
MQTYTVVDPRGDDAARLERFKETLHHELQLVAHVKLPALDLMFFPMIASEHSYVICFSIKNQRIDIIDNSSKAVSNEQKYGKKYMVMEHLKSEGLEAKSNRFKSVKPTRIKMAWRDNENKEDCGVYVMRQMETFMGSLAKDWDCGLVKGNRSQLDRLHVKYTAAILSAQINELRDENKNKAMKFFKKE